MIGLVNAIGTGQAARDLHARPTTAGSQTSRDVGEPPMWIRPHEAPSAPTETVQAVTPVEFQTTEAEQAQPADSALGQVLDTVA